MEDGVVAVAVRTALIVIEPDGGGIDGLAIEAEILGIFGAVDAEPDDGFHGHVTGASMMAWPKEHREKGIGGGCSVQGIRRGHRRALGALDGGLRRRGGRLR